MAQVERLPSKIVQYNNTDDVALCEDGSVWYYYDPEKKWTQIHPPHKPPAQAADLAEAVSLMWNLLFRTSLKGGKYKAASQQARDDARAFLKRMG